jgi:1,4-alpha-glucan branching enzyme
MEITHNSIHEVFSFTAPEARRVELVGDFTHWTKYPLTMQKNHEGIWRLTIDLEPGAHRYRYLVDGKWQDDPECSLRVPNPYGTHDAVRQVA